MSNAIFNQAEEGGLAKLEPEADTLFVSATVHEQIGRPNPKKEDYELVELSGVGTSHAGMGPQEIYWTIEGFVANDADYKSWLNKMLAYTGTAQRFTLTTKRGLPFENVELVGFRELEPAQDCHSDEVWCGFLVQFSWKQPATEIG